MDLNSAYNFARDIQPKLEELCAPLFQYLGISYFGYTLIIQDKGIIHLYSDKNWVNKRYTMLPVCSITAEKLCSLSELYKPSMYLTPEYPDKRDHVHCAAYEYGMWNGVGYFFKKANTLEFFSFLGEKLNNQFKREFYESNQLVFNYFIDDFEKKIKPYLMLNIDKVIIQKKYNNIWDDKESHNLKEFINYVDLYKDNESLPHLITPRQKEILQHLSWGKQMKIIAQDLDLSTRTVEKHIENIKEKIKIYSKQGLINFYTTKCIIDL